MKLKVIHNWEGGVPRINSNPQYDMFMSILIEPCVPVRHERSMLDLVDSMFSFIFEPNKRKLIICSQSL